MIVTSETVISGNHCIERFTDHLGQIYQQSYTIPSYFRDIEINAHLAGSRMKLEEALAEGEAQQVVES